MDTKAIDQVAEKIILQLPPKLEELTEAQAANEREIMASAGPIEDPPSPPPARPPLSEAVKRTQRLIEQIELGNQDRARLTADKLRRGVEIEGELRQAKKDLEERLKAVLRIHSEEVIQADVLRNARYDILEGAFEDLGSQRAGELSARGLELSKLDTRLEQLRKQLDAELGKMGAKVTA